MKSGKTLVELAQEIERQSESKRDFVAPCQGLTMEVREDKSVGLTGFNCEPHNLKNLAHRQLGEHTGIPAKYYDRMLEADPSLLATNVNHWLGRDNSKRMIRTLDGQIRAMLSDRYRPLENADLAEAVFPVLGDMDVQIVSAEITDTRFYIKAIDRRIEKDIPVGARMGDGSNHIFDTLSPALIISNSEVGLGALAIEAGVYTRACTNLAIMAAKSLRKYHVGGRHEIAEGLFELLSDKTRRVTDAATWSQVRDVVKAAFDRARFDAMADEMAGTTEQKILGNPVKAIEVTAKRFSLGEGEKVSVLRHLIEGGNLTRYGLLNAITRTAEDLPDYDRATEFERMGGAIIELPKNDWQAIAEAV